MLSLTVCLLCKPTEWSSLERRRVRTVRRRRQKMTHLGNVAKDHCSSWFRRRIFNFKCVYSEIPVNHLDDLHPEGQNGLCELSLTNWTRWKMLLLKYKGLLLSYSGSWIWKFLPEKPKIWIWHNLWILCSFRYSIRQCVRKFADVLEHIGDLGQKTKPENVTWPHCTCQFFFV